MLVKYKGIEPGCVAGFKKFMPGEIREVFDDEGMHLLGSDLFEIVEKKADKPEKRAEKKEDAKPLKKSAE